MEPCSLSISDFFSDFLVGKRFCRFWHIPFNSEDAVVRFLGFLLSLLVVLQLTSFPQIAFAADATYSQSSGVQAQVPVNKIGALLLVDAVAFLSNESVEVQGKVKGQEGQNNQTLLTGNITDRSITGSGASRTIHGKIRFTGGPLLADIGKSKTFDFEVPLTGCTGTTTVAGQCSHMSCTPAATHEPVVTKPTKTTKISTSTGEHCTAKRVIVTIACAALVATAIAVPVAVCCATRHHGHKNNNAALAQYFWSLRKPSVASTPVSHHSW
jgi:hypothetical protein